MKSAIVVFLLLCTPALAEPLSGTARVVDGDTIDVAGQRVRIWGVDAPERAQTCEGKPGVFWRAATYECGRDATAVMVELTRGRTVTCVPRGSPSYGRTVAICSTEAGDLGGAMVRRGWAVDVPRYSHGAYRAEEEAARREGLGLHAGRFTMPEQWRREHK